MKIEREASIDIIGYSVADTMGILEELKEKYGNDATIAYCDGDGLCVVYMDEETAEERADRLYRAKRERKEREERIVNHYARTLGMLYAKKDMPRIAAALCEYETHRLGELVGK